MSSAVWGMRSMLCLLAIAAGSPAEISSADPPDAPEIRPQALPSLKWDSKPTKIVCLGDSVTGIYYHTGGRRAYPEMLQVALKRARPMADIAVINAGISGNTTQNALERLDRDVLRHRPDLVTVTFGLNDMSRLSLDQFRENLGEIVARCQKSGSQVMLCTPNAVVESAGRPRVRLETYCNVIRAMAKESDIPLCDLYAAGEADRKKDARAWRLTLSDAIHPNMDGHKRMAEELCRSITGQIVSLSKEGPLTPALPHTLKKLTGGKPILILAMPPFDTLIAPAIKTIDPAAKIEVASWPIEGQTLAQIQAAAAIKVRSMKPDLVVLAIPGGVKASSEEQFSDSFGWVMNHSLSFGIQEWDCVVVHPAVTVGGGADIPRSDLIRQLVRAQDLSLIDREPGNADAAGEILQEWLSQQLRPTTP